MANGRQSYSLKDFIATNQIPKTVQVEDGFYDDKAEGTLSAGQIITLHTVKKTDKLRATFKTEDDQIKTLFIPLNCSARVEILPNVGQERYGNFLDLLRDFSTALPFVRTFHNIPWLNLKVGDILRPQNTVNEDRRTFLECEFYGDESRGRVKIPVDYEMVFEALAAADVYFLKEAVDMFPLPLRVRFTENNVSELNQLGIVSLEEVFEEMTVIATSCFENTVVVLNVSVDLDVTIVPQADPVAGDKDYARFCNFMHDGAQLEKFSSWINRVKEEASTVETIDEYEEIPPPRPQRRSRTTSPEFGSVDDVEEEKSYTTGGTTNDDDGGDGCHGSVRHPQKPPPRPPKPRWLSERNDVSQDAVRQAPEGKEDDNVFVDDEDEDGEEVYYEMWKDDWSDGDGPGDGPSPPPERSVSLKDENADDSDHEYLYPVVPSSFHSMQSNVSSASSCHTTQEKPSCSATSCSSLDRDSCENDKQKTKKAKKVLKRFASGIKRRISNLSRTDDAVADHPDDDGCDDSDDFSIITSPSKQTSDLSVRELGEWLQELKMGQYAHTFEEESIDGEMLCVLTKSELEDLGVKQELHQTKLIKFMEGWRPKI